MLFLSRSLMAGEDEPLARGLTQYGGRRIKFANDVPGNCPVVAP